MPHDSGSVIPAARATNTMHLCCFQHRIQKLPSSDVRALLYVAARVHCCNRVPQISCWHGHRRQSHLLFLIDHTVQCTLRCGSKGGIDRVICVAFGGSGIRDKLSPQTLRVAVDETDLGRNDNGEMDERVN